MNRACNLLATCLALAVATSAKGGTVFSNLGPEGTFATHWSYASDFLEGPSSSEIAWPFTSSGTGDVSQLRSALFREYTTSIPSHVTVRLYRNNAGAPGELLGAWPVTLPLSGTSTTPWTFQLAPSALLTAGSSYFISVQKDQFDSSDWVWWLPTATYPPDAPGAFRSQSTDPWALNSAPLPAFAIDVASCGTADFNHDGDTGTDADIDAFFACLGGNCCPTCYSADFNGDGDVGTDADIEAFFRVLGGGSC